MSLFTRCANRASCFSFAAKLAKGIHTALLAMRMIADLGLFRVIFTWPIQQAVEQARPVVAVTATPACVRLACGVPSALAAAGRCCAWCLCVRVWVSVCSMYVWRSMYTWCH